MNLFITFFPIVFFKPFSVWIFFCLYFANEKISLLKSCIKWNEWKMKKWWKIFFFQLFRDLTLLSKFNIFCFTSILITKISLIQYENNSLLMFADENEVIWANSFLGNLKLIVNSYTIIFVLIIIIYTKDQLVISTLFIYVIYKLLFIII
jgi:hypothetical protein